MRLTDLVFDAAARGRWRHGLDPVGDALRTPTMWGRAARRGASRVKEILSAAVLDCFDAFRRQDSRVISVETGNDPAPKASSVAIFVQFSASGRLSDMVQTQMRMYRDLGFAVVLVSNGPAMPADDHAAARSCAALLVRRRNYGLDFGAWKDALPLVIERWSRLQEVLLVNDSVLGPIRPVAPIIGDMRDAGSGFFGMVESRQGGPHLQSWFVLARGAKVVEDLADFFQNLALSRSKWLIVQRAELAMAGAMHRRGHRVAAAYGYADLVDTALSSPEDRAYLRRAVPAWFSGVTDASARERLLTRPLNPAHHLWRAFSGKAGCPFIKTDLVRRNPNGLPDVEIWPDLVPGDSPCPPQMLRDHLAGLGP